MPRQTHQADGMIEAGSSLLMVAGFPESIATFRGPLIRALLERGVKVHVAAPGLAAGSQSRTAVERLGVVAHDIPLQRTGTSIVADLRMFAALVSLMRQLRPAAVLGYTIKPVIYGTLAAWVAGVPRRFALITGLGYAFTGDRRGRLKDLIRLLYRFALRRADRIFFQNPDDLDLFRELGIIAPQQPALVVNGSGVDVSAFPATPVPEGPPSFLIIARLLGDKGVREYARAAATVRARYPKVRFRMAGWIDENPDAITRAELDAWVADGTIEFLGKLADVRPAIAEAAVYVLPSCREGTPRTVLEAMAMGRAIITTDAPGCRETVVDGDNGYLVPVRSVAALVEAMMKFVEEPGLAIRMGRRSRRIAEQKYDVHKVNESMLQEMGIASSPQPGPYVHG